jgi:hypothetical protein
MAFPPEAFIIGAQRSGTTSLASLLNQHPDITVSDPKEPDFFTINWDRGLDWYRSCFKQESRILVDASVSYAMAPVRQGVRHGSIVERILELSPQARFVYMVRDPAERCYSSYWHDVRAGREQRSLRQAVAQGAYYSNASFYYEQILNFLDHFSLDRFYFVSFPQFVRDPTTCASQCAAFFGANDGFNFKSEKAKNQAFLYNGFGRNMRDIFGENALKALSNFAHRHIPPFLHAGLKQAFYSQVPPMSDADRSWLSDRFREDTTAFQKLTGVSLSHDSLDLGVLPLSQQSMP